MRRNCRVELLPFITHIHRQPIPPDKMAAITVLLSLVEPANTRRGVSLLYMCPESTQHTGSQTKKHVSFTVINCTYKVTCVIECLRSPALSVASLWTEISLSLFFPLLSRYSSMCGKRQPLPFPSAVRHTQESPNVLSLGVSEGLRGFIGRHSIHKTKGERHQSRVDGLDKVRNVYTCSTPVVDSRAPYSHSNSRKKCKLLRSKVGDGIHWMRAARALNMHLSDEYRGLKVEPSSTFPPHRTISSRLLHRYPLDLLIIMQDRYNSCIPDTTTAMIFVTLLRHSIPIRNDNRPSGALHPPARKETCVNACFRSPCAARVSGGGALGPNGRYRRRCCRC